MSQGWIQIATNIFSFVFAISSASKLFSKSVQIIIKASQEFSKKFFKILKMSFLLFK
jgi:hypothetical protein